MGLLAFRVDSPMLQRCDLCKHPAKSLYKVQIGEHQYKFCSGMHANTATENYNQKKAKGITPANPFPLEEEE
mgnify:CR=1 FL=1